IIRVADRPAAANPCWSGLQPDPGSSFAPYRIYNIGNNQPVELLYFIDTLEKSIGKTAVKNLLPLQPADLDNLMHDTGFKPATSIEEGVSRFVAWYRGYYKC
ncbi:MAG: capsular biosynthesis protein CpsI, partial [Deltaproteobacteria bacterium]|nr:capsular biosynthesis protein CpsI [Deltaproteobacteria bacterium]